MYVYGSETQEDSAKRWMEGSKKVIKVFLIILCITIPVTALFQLWQYSGGLIVIPAGVIVVVIICCYPIAYGQYKSAIAKDDEIRRRNEIAERIKHFDENTKSRLTALIKDKKEFSISSIARIIAISPEHLKLLIFELSGSEKINGKFLDDDTFQIESSTDDFLSALDSQFVDWANREKSKLGKKI